MKYTVSYSNNNNFLFHAPYFAHGRCLEACRFYKFTLVYTQKQQGYATTQAERIKIGSSNGSLKVQIYDIL